MRGELTGAQIAETAQAMVQEAIDQGFPRQVSDPELMAKIAAIIRSVQAGGAAPAEAGA